MGIKLDGYSEDYFGLVFLKDHYHPLTPEMRNKTMTIPGMSGEWDFGSEWGSRPFSLPFGLIDYDRYELQRKLRTFVAFLVDAYGKPREIKLSFDYEPEKYYFVKVNQRVDVERMIHARQFSIPLIAHDPFAYAEINAYDPSTLYVYDVGFTKVSTTTDNYVGKVSGSTAENSHVAKHNALRATTGLLTPSTMPEEFSNNGYSGISTLNGALATVQTTANLTQGQQLFSFNLIAQIERKYGLIPASDLAGKVAWLKANLTKLTANWHGKGSNRNATPLTKADFVGKVAGSTVENPHIAKHNLNNATTGLFTPSTMPGEFGASYSNMTTLNGVVGAITSSQNGVQAQSLFSFNLIEHIKRKYGVDVPGATTEDKVAWLKANITKLTCNWHGKGSSPTGNKANMSIWSSQAAIYSAPSSHSIGSITKLTVTRSSLTNTMGDYIDNGFVHFLAYAEASDGTTASTIETDFVELEVELFAGENKASLARWRVGSSVWFTGYNHGHTTISKLAYPINTPFDDVIDANGFVHFLAHAPASNGIAASTIETDYIELILETNSNVYWLEPDPKTEPIYFYDSGLMYENPTSFQWVFARHYSGVHNYSPHNTPLIVEIQGSVINPRITNQRTGKTVYLPTIKNQKLTIDTGRFNVKVDGVSVMVNVRGLEDFSLVPGENSLVFEGGLPSATVEYKWKHKFI